MTYINHSGVPQWRMKQKEKTKKQMTRINCDKTLQSPLKQKEKKKTNDGYQVNETPQTFLKQKKK